MKKILTAILLFAFLPVLPAFGSSVMLGGVAAHGVYDIENFEFTLSDSSVTPTVKVNGVTAEVNSPATYTYSADVSQTEGVKPGINSVAISRGEEILFDEEVIFKQFSESAEIANYDIDNNEFTVITNADNEYEKVETADNSYLSIIQKRSNNPWFRIVSEETDDGIYDAYIDVRTEITNNLRLQLWIGDNDTTGSWNDTTCKSVFLSGLQSGMLGALSSNEPFEVNKWHTFHVKIDTINDIVNVFVRKEGETAEKYINTLQEGKTALNGFRGVLFRVGSYEAYNGSVTQITDIDNVVINRKTPVESFLSCAYIHYSENFEESLSEITFDGYDKYGMKSKMLYLPENDLISTGAVAFGGVTEVISTDIFPEKLSQEGVNLINLKTDGTVLPLINIYENKIELLTGEGSVSADEDFILDWYSMKVIIFNGDRVQVFLDNRELIPPTEVSAIGEKSVVFSANRATDDKIIIDNILVYNPLTAEAGNVWFYKNGCPVFRLTDGMKYSGGTLYNYGNSAVSAKLITVGCDEAGELVYLSSSGKLTAEAGRCVSFITEAEALSGYAKVKNLFWGESLAPCTDSVALNK